MLCPDCGVEVETLVEGACARCFTKRHDLAEVPKHIDVLLCTTCGARKDGAHWADATGRTQDEMIDEAVIRETKVHGTLEDPHIEVASEPQDDRNLAYTLMVDGQVAGLVQEAILETVVRIKPSVCTTCSRQAGGYFSAILQLRATERDLDTVEKDEAERAIVREIDRMVRAGNQNAFISKDVSVKGGKDYYISEIDVGRILAKKVADRFDADTKESASLVGRREGRDVYRVTFLVRVPPYRSGDFVVHRDRLHRVERVEKKTLALRDMLDHRETTIPRDQVHANDVAAKRKDVEEMMVVSVVRNEALVLDPVSNETHEVVLPDSLEYDLSVRQFDIVRHEGQAYFVGLPTERGKLRIL